MPARIKVYMHPGFEHSHPGEIQSECVVHGGMHLSGDQQDPEGECFYVTPIDYSGLSESYPRAHYQHLLILYNFDWEGRHGSYVHMPYGGSIEITAE